MENTHALTEGQRDAAYVSPVEVLYIIVKHNVLDGGSIDKGLGDFEYEYW